MVRVLIADDDADVLKLLSFYLKKQGYDVSAAHSSREALEKASAERPGVILLDVDMPEMDGIEVCRRLKALEPLCAIPVILVTGKDRDEDVVAGLDAGADDYLIKPVNGAILAARLRAAVRAKENHDTIVRINKQLGAEIAERKRIHESLRESEAKYRSLVANVLDTSAVGIFILDADFKVVWINRAMERYFHLKRDEIIGKDKRQFIQERIKHNFEDPEAFAQKVLATYDDNTYVENFECHVLPDGDREDRWLEHWSQPIRCGLYAGGRIEHYYDITAHKRAQRELAQTQRLKAIGRLAAGIAHEINTPTQYIGDNTRFLQEAFANLNTLLDKTERLLAGAKNNAVTDELITEVETTIREADIEYLTTEIPQAVQQSLEGVGHVAGIVRAMKEFSHPGGQRKQAVDLNHAIQNTLTVSRNEWKYVADLVTDFDPELPMVNCLPGDINQVILNLIVNAAQAVAEVVGDGAEGKGTITIRTRRDGDHAEIRIADTGPGIPEAIQPKVFDPFFTTKEVGKGTGQGLPITHAIIIEKHDGTITFETETGRGTTFIIRLPISSEPASEEETILEEGAGVCSPERPGGVNPGRMVSV